MHPVEVQILVILYFVKRVSELEEARTRTEHYVVDVFVELVVVRRVFSEIAPQHDLAGLLVHVQRLHDHHDIPHVFRKLLDHELVVKHQPVICAGQDVQFEPIDKDRQGIIRA